MDLQKQLKRLKLKLPFSLKTHKSKYKIRSKLRRHQLLRTRLLLLPRLQFRNLAAIKKLEVKSLLKLFLKCLLLVKLLIKRKRAPRVPKKQFLMKFQTKRSQRENNQKFQISKLQLSQRSLSLLICVSRSRRARG